MHAHRSRFVFGMTLVVASGFSAIMGGCSHRCKQTPSLSLHQAARLGDLSAVRAHLYSGTPVDLNYHGGPTALHCAAYRGHAEVVNALLEAGADPNARESAVGSYTPLHYATRSGQVEVVRVLLEYGADPNLTERGFRKTPLHIAADWGSTEIAALLIKHGADVEVRDYHYGCTPLHWAADAGRMETVKLLLVAGADVNALSTSGKTSPYDRAARSGHWEVAELIGQAGGRSRCENEWLEAKKASVKQ